MSSPQASQQSSVSKKKSASPCEYECVLWNCAFSFAGHKSVLWLQICRSRRIAWRILVYSFDAAPDNPLSSVFDCCFANSYTSLSLSVKSTFSMWLYRGGSCTSNARDAFVLRRETDLTRSRSLSTLDGCPALSGPTIDFLNVRSNGWTRRKHRSAAKSSIRLWIGVPVRHQRYLLSKAQAALNRLVDFSLIKCASRRFS